MASQDHAPNAVAVQGTAALHPEGPVFPQDVALSWAVQDFIATAREHPETIDLTLAKDAVDRLACVVGSLEERTAP